MADPELVAGLRARPHSHASTWGPARRDIRLTSVRIVVNSGYAGDPATSTPIDCHVEVTGDASVGVLEGLVRWVGRIAEIPNSLRRGAEVRIRLANA